LRGRQFHGVYRECTVMGDVRLRHSRPHRGGATRRVGVAKKDGCPHKSSKIPPKFIGLCFPGCGGLQMAGKRRVRVPYAYDVPFDVAHRKVNDWGYNHGHPSGWPTFVSPFRTIQSDPFYYWYRGLPTGVPTTSPYHLTYITNNTQDVNGRRTIPLRIWYYPNGSSSATPFDLRPDETRPFNRVPTVNDTW
jgi:hypothetical protein